MNMNPAISLTDMDATVFAVSDYLQLAAMSNRSVRMVISRDGVIIGEICVIDGDVHAANDESGGGAPAFSRLVFDSDVRVTCEPIGDVAPTKNIHGRIEHLLLDAARASDEQEHEDDAAVQIIELAQRRPPPPPPPPRRESQSAAPPPPPVHDSKRESTMGHNRHLSPPPTREPPEAAGAPGLSDLLTTTPGLRGATISNYDGELLLQAGEVDGETAAAVVATALRLIWQTCGEIGLGAPTSWFVTLDGDNWYVCHGEQEVVTIVGDAVDNPEATMRKLVAALGRVLS